MEEVKVRYWNRVEKIWYYSPDLADYESARNFFAILEDNNNFVSQNDCKPYRKTDLKDKYGNEIWEGDIISYVGKYWVDKTPKIETVTFEEGAYRPFLNQVDYEGITFDEEYESHYEVIGDIYQNRDLLK